MDRSVCTSNLVVSDLEHRPNLELINPRHTNNQVHGKRRVREFRRLPTEHLGAPP